MRELSCHFLWQDQSLCVPSTPLKSHIYFPYIPSIYRFYNIKHSSEIEKKKINIYENGITKGRFSCATNQFPCSIFSFRSLSSRFIIQNHDSTLRVLNLMEIHAHKSSWTLAVIFTYRKYSIFNVIFSSTHLRFIAVSMYVYQLYIGAGIELP